HGGLARAVGEGHQLVPRLVTRTVAVPDLRLGDRRELLQAGVPGGVVLRASVAVEPVARRSGREVPLVVGAAVVRAVAIGPPAVHRLGGQLPLDVAHGATLVVAGAGVRAVVTPEQRTGLDVVVDAEGVAQAHDVDLFTDLVADVVVLRGVEEVALGDGVGPALARLGAVLDLVEGLDPQDRAAQVVGVAGAAAGVEAGVHARGVVDRGVAVGTRGAGRRVVTRGEEEVALLVPRHVRADVAALTALRVDLDDLLLAVQVEALVLLVPLEAGEQVVAEPLVPVALVLALGQLLGSLPRGRGLGVLHAGGRDTLHLARSVDEVHPLVLLE